ncbi:hypothetical protein ACVDG5_026295 [Mesorhizobium sp. ORM6]
MTKAWLPQNKTARLLAGRSLFKCRPITWPVQALVPEQAREPVLVLVLVLAPGREPVSRASSVQPVLAPGPVCWPLAARRVPDARPFFRKRNTRQSPG